MGCVRTPLFKEGSIYLMVYETHVRVWYTNFRAQAEIPVTSVRQPDTFPQGFVNNWLLIGLSNCEPLENVAPYALLIVSWFWIMIAPVFNLRQQNSIPWISKLLLPFTVTFVICNFAVTLNAASHWLWNCRNMLRLIVIVTYFLLTRPFETLKRFVITWDRALVAKF